MNANFRHFSIIVLLFSACVCNADNQAEIKMQPAIQLPAVGLELQLPILFQINDPVEQFQALSAMRSAGAEVDQSIVINVIPVKQQVTAEQYSQSMLAEIQDNLAIRHLKVLSETQMQVASLKGVARSMEYSFRGVETSSISICFIRPMKAYAASNPASPKSLAYILTMEAAQKQKKQLLNTIDAVVKSIKLIEIQNPAELPVELKRRPFIKNFKRGMAIRQPEMWWVELTKTGINMGRFSYLVNKNSPMLQVHSVLIPDTLTAKDCGEKALEVEHKKGADFSIVSQGEVKLAGKTGYQFILEEILPLTNKNENAATQPTVRIVQARRLLCVATKERPNSKRHYAFILTCINTDVKTVAKMMDQLADNFDILPVVRDEDILKKPNPLKDRKKL